MLSNGFAINDGDDITYSSLTMRALQWNYDSLQFDLKNVALLSHPFYFPRYLTTFENGTSDYW